MSRGQTFRAGMVACVILPAVSGMEFIAALVASLAWPITVVMALILLRKPLGRWLQDRPSRIKAGPVEVE